MVGGRGGRWAGASCSRGGMEVSGLGCRVMWRDSVWCVVGHCRSVLVEYAGGGVRVWFVEDALAQRIARRSAGDNCTRLSAGGCGLLKGCGVKFCDVVVVRCRDVERCQGDWRSLARLTSSATSLHVFQPERCKFDASLNGQAHD